MYPGAFDPVHLGHVDIATRAAAIFDLLIVAVFDRPNKPLTFTGEQRIDLFRRAMERVPNVSVLGYDGLTVDFARVHGARFLVRGLRATADFEYEHQLASMNRYLAPGSRSGREGFAPPFQAGALISLAASCGQAGG